MNRYSNILHRFFPGKKRTGRNTLIVAGLLLVFLILTFLMARPVWNIYQTYRVVGDTRKEAREEYDSLLKRKEELEAEILRLQSERGIEEEVRNKFQVAKPDEEVIVLVDPLEGDIGENEDEVRGLWQRVKKIFR